MEKSNTNLIERYVYDVARRLPEKDREDVKKELRANIYDMLPDGVSDDAVKKVLYELGAPKSLAEKFRSRPRYLISPAYFDEYVSVLKWVVPLVGVLVMLIGFAIGAFEAAKGGTTNTMFVIGGVMSKGFSMGVTAAFQALLWTTIGFVIAEHSGEKLPKTGEHGWRIEDLPEVQNPKATIPLSEGIAEIVLTVVFVIFGILFCTGRLPFAMLFGQGDMVFFNIFSQSFLNMLLPVIIVSVLLSIVQSVAKIKDRRWSLFVCAAVVVKKIIDMALSLFLLNQPNILSEEFYGFLTQTGVIDMLPSVNGTNVIIIVLSVLVIISAIGETVTAIKKTVQAHTR